MIKKISPFVVLWLAFFLQLHYLGELGDVLPGSLATQPVCGVDAVAHNNRASALLEGTLPGDRPFPFIPLYPLFLAALLASIGPSLLIPLYAQALLQLLGISAVYAIGRSIYSPLAGLLAALGLATYSYYLYYVPCLDQTLLTVPSFSLAILFALKYGDTLRTRWLVLAGIGLAAAAMSRPTILVTFPLFYVWIVVARQRAMSAKTTPAAGRSGSSVRGWSLVGRDIVVLTLPFLIAVAPITWHNFRTSGRFILISDNFGVNLFTGNNPDAAGLDSLAHVQGQPAELRFREMVKREERGETTLAVEAVRYAIDQPGDWLALSAAKTWLWFGEVDERLVSPYFPLLVRQSRTLSALPVAWRALMIVAVLGLLLVRPGKRDQFLFILGVYGALSLVTILFFIQLRFRLPFAPFVVLLAASLLAAAPRWRIRQPVRFWITLTLLLLLYPLVPALWIFILLYALLGLWPQKKPWPQAGGRWARPLLALAAICVYLVVIGWWTIAESRAAEASQSIDHYLGPPLAAAGVLGQTFHVGCDGLYRIDLTLGVFDGRPEQPVTFYLASDTSGQEIIYAETFDGSLVRDYQRRSFTFPAVADSADRTFFFFVNSPNSGPQNAITVRGYTDTPVDRYPAGNAFAGQLGTLQQFEADMAFAAYCDLSPWQKMWRVLAGFIGR